MASGSASAQSKPQVARTGKRGAMNYWPLWRSHRTRWGTSVIFGIIDIVQVQTILLVVGHPEAVGRNV